MKQIKINFFGIWDSNFKIYLQDFACLYFYQFQAVCECFMEIMEYSQITIPLKYRGVKNRCRRFSNFAKSFNVAPWCRSVVVFTTAQLHSIKPELRFCAGSKPAWGVSEIRNGEDLWQGPQLEIRLNAFSWSTIPQKQFIIIIIIIIIIKL